MKMLRGIFIGYEYRTINYAKYLRKHRIIVTTAIYPTVEKGSAILRVACSSTHKKYDIKRLADALLLVIGKG